MTYKATVTSASGPQPAGSVLFWAMEGGTTTVDLGTAPMSAGAASITTTVIPAEAQGQTVYAAYLGDLSYAGAAGQIGQTINPASLTISAVSESILYGGVLGTFTFTGSGYVNGETAGTLTTQPTCVTTAKAIDIQGHDTSPVGQYPITCSGAADPNYTIAYQAGTLTISPTPLTITARSFENDYGTPITVAPIYTGLAGLDSQPATPPACGSTATLNSPVGVYPTTCSGAVDPDYTITYVAGQVTITQAYLDIHPSSYYNLTYRSILPPITWTADFRGTDGPSSLTTKPTCISTVAVNKAGEIVSPQGTYVTACSGGSASNYIMNYWKGAVTVIGATPTLKYTGPATAQVGKKLKLSFILLGVHSVRLKGRVVQMSLGTGMATQICQATTGTNGSAACIIKSVKQKKGKIFLGGNYGGDLAGPHCYYDGGTLIRTIKIT